MRVPILYYSFKDIIDPLLPISFWLVYYTLIKLIGFIWTYSFFYSSIVSSNLVFLSLYITQCFDNEINHFLFYKYSLNNIRCTVYFFEILIYLFFFPLVLCLLNDAWAGSVLLNESTVRYSICIYLIEYNK